MRSCLALLALPLLLTTRAAVAQPAPAAPLPYAAWDGASPLAEPPPLAEEKPQALPRAADFSRHTVELGPDLGLALPSCTGHVDASSACGALAPGFFVGASVLWRPNPYFAFGGGVHLADFGGKADMVPSGASGRFYEASAVARVFMMESGRVEPYLEIWIGGGTQRTSAAPALEPRFEQRSVGVGGRIGGGVDFYVSEQLRLGPSIGALRYFSTSSERCTGGRCAASPLAEHGQLMGAYVLALRGSFGFGSRH